MRSRVIAPSLLSLAWLAGGVLLLTCAGAAAQASGDYIADVSTGAAAEHLYARVALTVTSGRVSGTWGERRVSGSVKGTAVVLAVTDASGTPAGTLTGTVTGATISGDGSLLLAPAGRSPGAAPRPTPVTWTLAAYTPPAQPKVHDFEPSSFYTTYSAQWAPVLRLYPGDSVRTRTVDNDRDADKPRYGVGGNPSTGPFYVEGALPGDTLVVRLVKLRANKRTARQGTRMNARAATANYLVAAKYDPAVSGEWTLDLENGVATPSNPTPGLKGLRVPIRTMLGCVSVAPPGQDQMRGTDLGVFGGNLDFNENVEGTTLYFPVFHAGALFGIGDAHAGQGDGEVTGSALETSADVEFTVDVIKGVSYAQVRAETRDHLISFGVSGSVPESIQAATTQMAEWLTRDYALSDSEVAVLLGAVLEYEIAELVDPHLNVAAKVSKAALAPLPRR